MKYYRDSDSAESKELSVGWLDLISSDSHALNHKIPPAVLNMIYASVSGHLIPAGSIERYRTHRRVGADRLLEHGNTGNHRVVETAEEGQTHESYIHHSMISTKFQRLSITHGGASQVRILLFCAMAGKWFDGARRRSLCSRDAEHR